MRLQYAIDVYDRRTALELAETAVECGVGCIEAGHLLIKTEGISVVSDFKSHFPDVCVVADMKTMDMGRDECRVAVEAGADVVIVCAGSSDGTITAAHEEAAASDREVMVSLMGIDDRLRRAKEVVALGADWILAHRGIDDVYTWADPRPRADLLEMLAIPDIRVALGGDIGPATIHAYTSLPIDTFVVGRGITAASDPREAINVLLSALQDADSDAAPVRSARKTPAWA